MANSDASSSTTCTVRVLVSFSLAAPDDSSSARTSPIHKEKFNVPLSSDEHKDLFNFVRHLKTFTGLAEIAKSKGLGGNPEVTIARVQKAGSGVFLYVICLSRTRIACASRPASMAKPSDSSRFVRTTPNMQQGLFFL